MLLANSTGHKPLRYGADSVTKEVWTVEVNTGAARVVTDRQTHTHTQTDYCNPLHMRRGLIIVYMIIIIPQWTTKMNVNTAYPFSLVDVLLRLCFLYIGETSIVMNF